MKEQLEPQSNLPEGFYWVIRNGLFEIVYNHKLWIPVYDENKIFKGYKKHE